MARSKRFSKEVRRSRFFSYRPVVEFLEDRTVLSFIAPVTYDAGSADFVAVGDFNGDGRPDLAVVDDGDTGAVGIWLGNGNGSFQFVQNYYVGSNPRAVAIGDFNGDGHLDLAVINNLSGSGIVSILLGNGDGTFQAAQNYDVGLSPRSVAAGDFNGDGHLDLAVADSGPGPDSPGMVSILLSNGDGTFQPARNYVTGNSANFLAVADFNGDGIADIAVTGNEPTPPYQGTVSILLGKGDGTFQPAQNYAAGYDPVSVAVGDFNGDGVPDLAVVNFENAWPDGAVTVLLGKGDGSFGQVPLPYNVGLLPTSVAVGDFNGDGKLDLLVANQGSMSLLLGNGDGTFGAAETAMHNGSSSVAVADFNGDGRLDFAVVGGLGVIIVLGNGDGTFKVAPDYGGFEGASSVAVGDFNGDGSLDLAMTSCYGVSWQGAGLNVLLGKGDGTFGAAQNYGVGRTAVAVGDFNGDGFPDLAVVDTGSDYNSGTLTILLGNGDGSFQVAHTYAVGGSASSVTVADFNGDGFADLAVTVSPGPFLPGWVSIFLGNGYGTFKPPVNFTVGDSPVSMVVGDFNGDGYADLAVANFYSHDVSILLGDGYGNFLTGSIPFLGNVQSVAAGDFNGDGILDLAVTNDYPVGRVTILLGNGDGTFQVGQSYPNGSGYVPVGSVAVGDFNRDGIADLAVQGVGGVVTILLGNGDGTFRVDQSYVAGSDSGPVAVADLNGDGFPDLITAEGSVLLNAADWGGGHAAIPFRRLALDPVRLLGTAWTPLASARPQDLRLPPESATELPTSPMQVVPVKTDIGQADRRHAFLPTVPVMGFGQHRGAQSDPWVDSVLDVLAWSLLR